MYVSEAIVVTSEPIRRAREPPQVEHKSCSFSSICSQVGAEGKPCEICSGLLHMATPAKHCASPRLWELVTFNYLSLYNLIHIKESIESRNSLPSVRKKHHHCEIQFLFCQVAEAINNYPLDWGLQNYGLLAKSSLLPVFVNKVLLEHSHAHSFTDCL